MKGWEAGGSLASFRDKNKTGEGSWSLLQEMGLKQARQRSTSHLEDLCLHPPCHRGKMTTVRSYIQEVHSPTAKSFPERIQK